MENNPKKLYKPISEFEWKDASEEEIKQDSLPHYADKFETMEKINTPLMAHIEFINSAISGLNKLQLSHKKGSNGFQEIEGKIWSLEAIKKNAESLLPTERDVMIKCAEYDVSYMALKMHDTYHEQDCECEDCADMQHETATAYINKNFKSYE